MNSSDTNALQIEANKLLLSSMQFQLSLAHLIKMNSVILFSPLNSGAVNRIVYQLEMEEKKIQIFIFICNYVLVILKSVIKFVWAKIYHYTN